jgi:hypothetical protein
MRLLPLKQWICDTCHEVIQSPHDGWLEWIMYGDSKCHRDKGFGIVHGYELGTDSSHETDFEKGLPPLYIRPSNCCYGDEFAESLPPHHTICGTPLEQCTGRQTMPFMLFFIDPESYDEDHEAVEDLREWAEIVRRLSVKYYEEARLYWDRAKADGFFDQISLSRYSLRTLLKVIKRYGDRDPA